MKEKKPKIGETAWESKKTRGTLSKQRPHKRFLGVGFLQGRKGL